MSKKKNKKEFNEFKKYIAITLFVCIILSALGFKINSSRILIVYIVVLLFALLFVFLSTPYIKGKIGEYKISRVLNKITKKYSGKIVNDVVIVDDNKSSQIDHVLFHTSGIYVIETKNYSGRIYGKYNQKEWTQVLAYGRVKNKLYSPIFQNYVHIKRLESILDIDNINSCVVFVKGNIKFIDVNNVYSPKTLRNFILNQINEPKYTLEEINELYNKLNGYKITPIKTGKEHVNNIRTMKDNINKNICPNCNIPLVLRTSKNGNQFYGCRNFPNCKFTKKVD